MDFWLKEWFEHIHLPSLSLHQLKNNQWRHERAQAPKDTLGGGVGRRAGGL
jgi:hypothetical protein